MTYSGNILRLKAPSAPRVNPGGPDSAHDMPSGPEGVPDYRAEEISVPGDLGTQYAGLTLEDGVPRAIVAGQPSEGWNAPHAAMNTPGGGGTPAGYAPNWTSGDPHSAEVDTSFAGGARGAIAGSPYNAGIRGVHGVGDDTKPAYLANQVGTEGTRFLEREVDFPKATGAEPSGPGADKFIAGTNAWSASNPEGDNFTNRWGARVHYGFESDYFVHTPMFQDKPAQTYDRRVPPAVATDPRVGGSTPRTPSLGTLASNPWLTELGTSVEPSGYGVAVDGVM